MSREGRSQPIQPFASHGFLGNTPANGVLPGLVTVVEPDDRRRKTLPLQATIISGVYALAVAPTAAPPGPTIVAAPERPRATSAPTPTVEHGFVDSGVGVPGTTPPGPVNIDRADQRTRYKPLDATSLAGIPADQFAPAVLPAGPFVVPLDERRRFLAALPAQVTVGYDDAEPPEPYVVEPDDKRRRRQTPDPLTISGVLAGLIFVPVIAPQTPIVVFSDERLLRRVLPSTVLVGPAPPFVPPPPPTVQAGTDWAGELMVIAGG